MTKIIAVVNVCGGTGKTTTAVNVAACLAACGRKTLLIDADPQADSTRQLTPTNGDILKCKGLHFLRHDIELEKAIRETLEPGLYILPSSIDLLDFQHQLRVNKSLVIKKTIPFDAKLSESAQHHQSIIRYDSKSAGAIRYQAVTKEILQRIGV